jgi:hypothetical protein
VIRITLYLGVALGHQKTDGLKMKFRFQSTVSDSVAVRTRMFKCFDWRYFKSVEMRGTNDSIVPVLCIKTSGVQHANSMFTCAQRIWFIENVTMESPFFHAEQLIETKALYLFASH